jgi:transposase
MGCRAHDQQIIGGIIFVIRNGLLWRDAGKKHGPHKTIYNQFVRWCHLGVFNRVCGAVCQRRKTRPANG